MKTFSIWSIGFIALGILSFGLSWKMESYFEPIVLIGFVFILIGVVFSFIAFAKKEKGSIKFISLVSFFIILFLVSWLEPLQVVRIMTSLKYII